MPITFNNFTTFVGNTNSYSWLHEVSATSCHGVIVVATAIAHTGLTVAASAVKFGTQTFIKIRADRNASDVETSLWVLCAPNAGVHTITVDSLIIRNGALGAITYCGVDQINPATLDTGSSGSGTISSINLNTTTNGTVVLDVFGSNNDVGLFTKGAGQTLRWDTQTTGSPSSSQAHGAQSTEDKAVAGGVTMSWNINDFQDWAHSIVVLGPAVLTNGKMKPEFHW